jgi:hypothetical protein
MSDAEGAGEGGEIAPVAGSELAAPADAPEPAYWPRDWRETTAAAIGGGDEKIVAKELRRLQRFADPTGIYGQARALEARFSEGGLVKVPGPRATAEEIAAYRRAAGVPEKPSDYFDRLQLASGTVIGTADRPIAESFAAAVHPAGATPEVVSAALDWYYRNEAEQAAALDEADEAFREESERALREEFGPSFQRKINRVAALFADAPGGADPESRTSLYARLLGGRTADGKIIGNDPDMMRFLVALSGELAPAPAVTEAGDPAGRAADEEIAEIERRMKTDRRGYFRDDKMQARYRELVAARERRGW